MTEDANKRDEPTEAAKDQSGDILKGLGFKDASGITETRSLSEIEYLLSLVPPTSAPRRVDTYVIVDTHGREVKLRVEVEEPEHFIDTYLAQIDDSRAQAQTTQDEIDQLRTETREIISKLLTA